MDDRNLRTTSAGYRLPVGQTSTVYRGVSEKVGPDARPSGGKPSGRRKDTVEHDEVSQNKIWREQVHAEWKGVDLWQKHWGFMADYDPRGRPKTPRELPEKVSVYSNALPNSKGHEYGSRIETDIGQKMTEMEFLFDRRVRKSKMGQEFACY